VVAARGPALAVRENCALASGCPGSKLNSLAEGSAGLTSLTFSPDGTRIAYVQDNDLYTIGVGDGKVVRLTTDGSDTVFNGTLDWVYNEELATRSSQPAYAWSPDGRWLLHLRLDEAEVQNHSITDYRTSRPRSAIPVTR